MFEAKSLEDVMSPKPYTEAREPNGPAYVLRDDDVNTTIYETSVNGSKMKTNWDECAKILLLACKAGLII